MKVIFLDIDGVLNGQTRLNMFIGRIAIKFKLTKKLWFKWDLFGIRTYKVYLLSKIIKATGAKVVISSSWRSGWYLPYEENGPRMKSLKDKFKKFNIDVIGVTPRNKVGLKRDYEIDDWISSSGYNIESFVILDDEPMLVQKYIDTRLVQTSNVTFPNIVKGLPHEKTGLSRKHVKKAINILNTPLEIKIDNLSKLPLFGKHDDHIIPILYGINYINTFNKGEKK